MPHTSHFSHVAQGTMPHEHQLALKSKKLGTGEIAQWLRTLRDVKEEPGSVSSIHKVAHSDSYTSVLGELCSLLAVSTASTWSTNTHASKTLT